MSVQHPGAKRDARRQRRECMDDDLRDFAESHRLPFQADPDFRDLLRQKIWLLVRRNAKRKAGRTPRTGA